MTDNNKFVKTGLFQAKVAAINPTQSEIGKLLGKDDVNWKTDYIGTTKDGDARMAIEVWLQEVNSNEYFRLRLSLLKKERESKNTGNFQWVNTQGQTVYATDEKDLKGKQDKGTSTMYEGFRKLAYRKAYVGEEALANFMRAWILQGKKPLGDEKVMPDVTKLFSGDFSELQSKVDDMQENTIGALACISNGQDGKQYQNVYKDVVAGWMIDGILNGTARGQSQNWVDQIKSQYGCKDEYSLKALDTGSSKPTAKQEQPQEYDDSILPF